MLFTSNASVPAHTALWSVRCESRQTMGRDVSTMYKATRYNLHKHTFTV